MELLQTEHGIFTNNEHTGQTAQEVYADWLANKDSPPPQSEIDLIRLEMAESNTELFEMIMVLLGGME